MVLGARKQGFLMGLGKLEAQIFSEVILIFAVELAEGHIKRGHDPSFLCSIWDGIVLGVVKLKVDYLVDDGGTIMPEIVELIKVGSIGLEFVIFSFGHNKLCIVSARVIVGTK